MVGLLYTLYPSTAPALPTDIHHGTATHHVSHMFPSVDDYKPISVKPSPTLSHSPTLPSLSHSLHSLHSLHSQVQLDVEEAHLNWGRRSALVRQQIVESDPDLLCLEEVRWEVILY